MHWWNPFRHLYNQVRQRGLSGHLQIIPTVLSGLIPHAIAVAAYLTAVGDVVRRSSVSWGAVTFYFLLAAAITLGVWGVWRVTRPSRRIAWVHDWLGGGLLAITAVWASMGVMGYVEPSSLDLLGRLLIPIMSAVWGVLGTVLLLAATVALSDELRTERLERQRLEALMDFTHRMTSLDYQAILDEVISHLRRLLDADSCVLFLWEEAGQVLAPVSGYHDLRVYSAEYVQRTMNLKCPMGFGLAGYVMKTGEPHICDDVDRDPHAQPVLHGKSGEQSCLVAPIQMEGRRLGVVRLTRAGLHQFNQDDMDLVMSYAGQAAMVLEHGRMLKELSELSTTDALTGLFNARHFRQVIEVEVTRSHRYDQPLTLVLTDSDSLKQVNDRFGHQKGDELLKFIAQTLKATVRITDYAFRYAGDEFIILLPNTGPEEATLVAERIRAALQHPVGEGVEASVSVGVATLPLHAGDSEGLMIAADRAMYQSKRSGKNRVTVAGADGPAPR